MMRIIADAPDEVALFVQLRCGAARPFENYTAMGVYDEHLRLLGGFVYHNYQPEAELIEISGASATHRWFTWAILRALFEYPFVQLGCQMVVMRVAVEDAALKRMLTAYGFECITIRRLRGRDKDENIFTLTDDAWKANKFNKRMNRLGQIYAARARAA